jgi:hypothetical protein
MLLTNLNCSKAKHKKTIMLFKAFSTILLFSATFAQAEPEPGRRLKGGMSMGMSSKSVMRMSAKSVDLKITVQNLAYSQPMGPFFVVVHNEDLPPLYELGKPAPDNGLQLLAEDGSPDALIDYYTGDGPSQYTSSVGAFADDSSRNLPEGAAFLLELGEESSTIVTVSSDYPYVSMASMAVNTNDCFVGFAGMMLEPGMSFTTPGYDSGTEENNENCDSVPGPACPMGSGNAVDGNGEGIVHVHRGVHGVSDLTESVYDWRNPMLLVTVDYA